MKGSVAQVLSAGRVDLTAGYRAPVHSPQVRSLRLKKRVVILGLHILCCVALSRCVANAPRKRVGWGQTTEHGIKNLFTLERVTGHTVRHANRGQTSEQAVRRHRAAQRQPIHFSSFRWNVEHRPRQPYSSGLVLVL